MFFLQQRRGINPLQPQKRNYTETTAVQERQMRKFWILIILLLISILVTGCCQPGDNACYKVWWGLEPNPIDPNLYTEPWERFLSPELRNSGDPGNPFWDWIFGVEPQKN